MLIGTLVEPGKKHFNRSHHLVFVLLNALQHGLNRTEPEPFECECGNILTPDELDKGDETKTSWPHCQSWRDGGKKKCPECEEYPSIERAQHFRAKGYEATPKSEIKSVTPSQREAALEDAGGQCVACDSDAEYVKRMVPPRYGGNRDSVNLAPLCSHHYEDFGHLFADILEPAEWYQIHGVDWAKVTEDFLEGLDGVPPEHKLRNALKSLLEEGQLENPYPYIRR